MRPAQYSSPVLALGLVMAALLGSPALGCKKSSQGAPSPGASSSGPSPVGPRPPSAAASPAPPDISLDAFCKEVAEAGNALRTRTCTEADKATKEYDTRAKIEKAAFEFCVVIHSQMLNKSRVRFRTEHAEACIRQVKDNAAVASHARKAWDALPACAAVFEGQQGKGEACQDHDECKRGLVCAGGVSKLEAELLKKQEKDGMCQEPSALGQPCEPHDDETDAHPPCVPGAYCKMSAKSCMPRASVGGKCSSNMECVAGAKCQVGICATGSAGTEGARCKDDSDCPDRAYCEGADTLSEPAKPGLCTPQKTAGKPCRTMRDECLGFCEEDKKAQGKGTCKSLCGSG